MAKRKRTNNDLQNTRQKIKDGATRTPVKKTKKNGVEFVLFARVNSSSSTKADIRCVTYQVINQPRGNVKITETFDKGQGV